MKISVIIPMYNAEKTIIRALNSVLEQTSRVHEIIIINDGSKDNSLKIVEDFLREKSLKNLKLISKENEGVSTARNIGIKVATGDWLAFLDADDYWRTNKIERQCKIIVENPIIDLLGTGRNEENITHFLSKKIDHLTHIPARLLLYKNFFSTPTVVMRKSIVEKVGYFDEKQKYAEEGDYWIRICNRYHCSFLNESLVNTDEKPYYGHSGLSGNIAEMEKGELKNMRTAYQLGVVKSLEYNFLKVYSLAKYFRRLLIVKFR